MQSKISKDGSLFKFLARSEPGYRESWNFLKLIEFTSFSQVDYMGIILDTLDLCYLKKYWLKNLKMLMERVMMPLIQMVRCPSQWLLTLVMDIVLRLDPSVMVLTGSIISVRNSELCILHGHQLGVDLPCMGVLYLLLLSCRDFFSIHVMTL